MYTGSAATGAFVQEDTSYTNKSETTAKFKIKFSVVNGVSGGAHSLFVYKIFNDSGTLAGYMELQADGSGNITSYRCNVQNNSGSSTTSSVTLTGIATDTYYDVYVYHKSDASSGGIACKIGSWSAAATSFTQINNNKPNGKISFGATETYWTGATPFTMTIDDFYLSDGDQR